MITFLRNLGGVDLLQDTQISKQHLQKSWTFHELLYVDLIKIEHGSHCRKTIIKNLVYQIHFKCTTVIKTDSLSKQKALEK